MATKNLPAGAWTQEQGEAWLRFGLLHPDTGNPGLPILGKYENAQGTLIFQPRFPLQPGQKYRATFGVAAGQTLTAEYRVPLPKDGPPTTVLKVYPTDDVLPANHLKFYVYFSGPMQGGEKIFDHICILDADGNEIRDPWLRDEIWDEKDQRLIIYIHPGRIKWGVLLRELLGPVLVPRREYTLVVKSAMLDIGGRKLAADFAKKFRTAPEDRNRIELKNWTLKSPAADSLEPFVVHFGKALDHAGLKHHLSIRDARDKEVAGTVDIGLGESSWSFTPAQKWAKETYMLVVDSCLEDVAGNTPARPFDVDLKSPRLPPQSLRLTFQPR